MSRVLIDTLTKKESGSGVCAGVAALAKFAVPAAALLVMLAVVATARPAMAGDVEKGKAIFEKECAGCHGKEGKGDGPFSVLVDPKPRDFGPGLYKIRSTATGELPTDADLIKTVTRGMPGSGMPSFEHLGEETIKDVVAYVKTLGGPEGEEGNWFDLYEVPPPVKVPEPLPDTEEVRKAGAAMFIKMGCEGCHGKTGHGDAKKPGELLDNWGHPLHARDYSAGVFKGGHEPEQLYTRIMTGLDGSPMTAFWNDAMTPEERWTVVRYVMAFGPPLPVKQPSRGTIKVARGALPASLKDAAWDKVPASTVLRMPLAGGWIRYFNALEVRAVLDGNDMALKVSWDDKGNTCPSFKAIFPTAKEHVSFELGSPERPVIAWSWSEKDGARAIKAVGVGAENEEALDVKLSAEAVLSGDQRSVMLKGSLPSTPEQLLLMVAGCEKKGAEDGEFLTASTLYDIK